MASTWSMFVLFLKCFGSFESFQKQSFKITESGRLAFNREEYNESSI